MDARRRYIGSEIYRGSTYGGKHPRAVPRVSTATDLCRAMGWWLVDEVFVEAPMAAGAQVTRFRDRPYIAALRRTETTQCEACSLQRKASAKEGVLFFKKELLSC